MRAVLYRDVALALPLLLIGMSSTVAHRWACTIMAGCCAVVLLALSTVAPALAWGLPAGYPLLLLAPALALDGVRRLPPRLRLVREALTWATLMAAAVALVHAPAGCPSCGPLDFGALVAIVAR